MTEWNRAAVDVLKAADGGPRRAPQRLHPALEIECVDRPMIVDFRPSAVVSTATNTSRRPPQQLKVLTQDSKGGHRP